MLVMPMASSCPHLPANHRTQRGVSNPGLRRAAISVVIATPRYLQHREKRLLRDLYSSHALHPPLAFLLLFEQLSLARNVSAVAFGEHVFPQCGDCFPGNNLAPDCGLQRNLELLARN